MKTAEKESLQWLIWAMIIGAALRIGYLFEIAKIPFFENPVADAEIYYSRAMEILAGKFLPDTIFFHSSPVYPYFLAFTYKLIGGSLAGPRIVQALCGVVNIAVMYFIVRKVFNKASAIIAAFCMAVYPIFIYYEGDLMMIPLVLFTLNLSCLGAVMYQQTRRLAFLILCGVMLGLAALGKPDTIMIAPFVALWLWFTHPDLRRGFVHTVILTVSVIATLMPVTVMNYIVGKELVLLTSNGGVNFYIGNHDGADGMFHLPPDSGLWDHRLYMSSKEVAEDALEKQLTPAEVSKYWFGRGAAFVVSHPLGFLKLWGRKLFLMINRYEISNHHSFYFFKRFSNVLAWNPLRVTFFVFFGVIGVYYALFCWRSAMVPLLYLTVTGMVTSLFFVTSRYRLPTVMYMILFSAYAVQMVWHKVCQKRWIELGILYAVSAGLAVISVQNIPDFSFSLAQDFNNLGNVYADQGEFDNALACYKYVLKKNPGSMFTHFNIAQVYDDMGKRELAMSHYIQEIEVNPVYPPSYLRLAYYYAEDDKPDKAREYLARIAAITSQREALINIGYMYHQLGDLDIATRIFEQLHDTYPDDPIIQRNLTQCYTLQKTKPAQSVE